MEQSYDSLKKRPLSFGKNGFYQYRVQIFMNPKSGFNFIFTFVIGFGESQWNFYKMRERAKVRSY